MMAQNLVRLSIPFANEAPAGSCVHGARLCQIGLRLHRLRQLAELAFGRCGEPAERPLLQLPGDAELENIAAQLFGWIGTKEALPSLAEFGLGHGRECCDRGLQFRSVVSIMGRAWLVHHRPRPTRSSE